MAELAARPLEEQIVVRVPAQLHADLQRVARIEGNRVSSVVRRLLRQAVERELSRVER